MIVAKNGRVKISGYTFRLLKETIGIINSLMETDAIGEEIEFREAMLTTMIKVAKCKVTDRDPMEIFDDLSKEEVKAFILLMKAFSVDIDEDDEEDGEDNEEDMTDFGSGDSHGKVTIICGGKKVVTDADGVGKIIADMVADELKNDGKEKK